MFSLQHLDHLGWKTLPELREACVEHICGALLNHIVYLFNATFYLVCVKRVT